MENFASLHLQNIGQMIIDTVDFEESAVQHRVVVRTNVDEELDEMKRMFDGMESMLAEVSRDIGSHLPENVGANLNVIYFPQLGYLVAVPVVPKTPSATATNSTESEEVRPAFVGEDWEYKFCTATSWYYKNPQMREMDDHFGDMYGIICGK